MRILDKENGKLLSSIVLMLTQYEAKELIDAVKSINISKEDHVHIADEQFQREITILIYTKENIHLLDENVRSIVLDED